MWDRNVEQVLEKLNSSEEGLNQKQAEQRLLLNGKNEIPKGKEKTKLNVFLQQFKSPIVLILVVASIFSVIIKSFADAIFIVIVITINAIIGAVQEWKSKKSADKLQDMIKIKARVVRENILQEINSENVVIGDIVDLESGSKVPADLRLIDAKKLSIDESILTRRNQP